VEVINEPIATVENKELNIKINSKTLMCNKPDCGGYCGSEHQSC